DTMAVESPNKSFRTIEVRQKRVPMQENTNTASQLLVRHNSGDRFFPDRGSLDLDVARVTLNNEEKESSSCPDSPRLSKEAYRKHLCATMVPKSRILSFQRKPPPAPETIYNTTLYSSDPLRPLPMCSRSHRYIPQCPERTLDAPEILDDYYMNLMEWGTKNVLAIALGQTVYLH
ncbi:hypothetical protein KI387_002604, partial [Taxus chinensis]